jgi:hypothetical protein
MRAPTKLLAAGSLILALGACATQPTEVAEQAAGQKQCLRETGTRIDSRKGECVNGSGRSYTREEIERTGGNSTGEGLRRLGVR